MGVPGCCEDITSEGLREVGCKNAVRRIVVVKSCLSGGLRLPRVSVYDDESRTLPCHPHLTSRQRRRQSQ
jgi:hypothetical protein